MDEHGKNDGDPGVRTGVNRLATSTSPYLRQHAENPVNWYPWGSEALERAVREDRPILLSVGYSACHWCHVMAHESFEDPETAREMNAWFVNIKVDREERPDVDAVYQRVVALMGQGGGWPLTVFLTPDQRPFYGGTYFPPRPSYGRPSFRQVLGALHDAWENRREEIDEQAGQFMDGFAELSGLVDQRAADAAGLEPLESAAARRHASGRLLERIDPQWGGLGGAPKFPNVPALGLLLERAKAEAASEAEQRPAGDALQLTLEQMWRGGIYDHLRGGFARYSVDREWLVPHFEKMLYDNALLLELYADASVLWPELELARDVVTQTVEYLVADMRSPEGPFYSATDADSEGVEGKFFCWTPNQLREVLDDADLAELFGRAYGVTAEGNFEHGMSILHRPRPWSELAQRVGVPLSELQARLAGARARLLEARYRRVPPQRDEKILTAWNGLLVSGLCRASSAALAWGDASTARRWRNLARDTARAVCSSQVRADGSVMRAAWAGEPHTRGYLDDVAALARACLDVHEMTAAQEWIDRAARLADHALSHYGREGGGFWFTADDAEKLVERTESQHDSPMPSGLAMMVESLARLDACGRAPAGAARVVEATLERFRGASAEPFAFAGLLAAAAWVGPEALTVTLRGDPDARDSLWRAARVERLRVPYPVSIQFEPSADPPEAVVCRGRACTLPLHTPEQLRARLTDPEL